MITVTLHPDGTGLLGLPGRSMPIDAPTISQARENVVQILTGHAAVQSGPLEVHAIDNGNAIRLAVYPDGQVVVARTGATRTLREPVGPALAPAPYAPPEAYTPTGASYAEIPTDTENLEPAPTTAAGSTNAPQQIQGPAPRHGAPELPPELDMTRIVQPGFQKLVAVLEFTTGDIATIDGTALVGRRPTPHDDEDVDQLIIINDPGRSVSKTHFMAGWRDGEFWITDRESGNGTTVSHDEQDAVPLRRDTAHTLVTGDRVTIGDHAFNVRIEASDEEQSQP